MKKVFFAFVFIFMSSLLFSEEVIELSIEKAINIAVKNNYNYLISKEEVKQYKQRLKQNMGFLPIAHLEGAKNLSEKLMEIEMPPMFPGDVPKKVSLDFTKNYEFTFQIVQPLFTGGKIWHSYKNAKLDLNIAREKERNTKDEVILNVKKLFFNIIVMKELVKAQQEAMKLAENNYNNINEKYKLGMVSKYDLLRAELNMASIKPKILNVEKLLKLLTINLKTMLRIPDRTRIVISGKLEHNSYELELSEFIKKSLLNSSEILQLNMQLKKARNLLKIAYAQYIPDFSIIARYSYRSDAFKFTSNNWDNNYTINLGISFPIFTGLKRSAKVGEMKVMKKILDLNLKQLNDGTITMVKELYYTIDEEFKNIQTGLKSIETAKEGVRIADLNYKEGLISILELNTSFNQLTNARVAYLQAAYNYKIALSELEKVSGINISGGEK